MAKKKSKNVIDDTTMKISNDKYSQLAGFVNIPLLWCCLSHKKAGTAAFSANWLNYLSSDFSELQYEFICSVAFIKPGINKVGNVSKILL